MLNLIWEYGPAYIDVLADLSHYKLFAQGHITYCMAPRPWAGWELSSFSIRGSSHKKVVLHPC